MMKQNVKNYFKKAGMFLLAIVMMASMAWMFDGEASVAYAAVDETNYITESQTGLTIAENMTAPKPTTEGKETYIFAGYFADENCEVPVTTSTSEKVYKKFVPAEIMSVKAQVTKGTKLDSDKTDMRLVTTVDSLDYKEVGFDVYFNGATNPVNAKTTTVYKRIIAADNGNAFGYSPEAFDTDSEYFTTVNLVNIANKNFDKTFFIKPYWKTLDGTKVYGISRMARVSDSYNGIANVPVRIYADSIAEENAITVTYDSVDFTYQGFDIGNVDAGATVAVNGDGTITCTTSQALANVNDMLVNLRFKINDTASSNERFDMVGTGACAYLYKVFSTSYNGTPDTSWYVEFKDEKEFVVSTPADLYGLAEIVNATEGDYKTEQFSGDTIKLGADMDLNTSWNAPKTADEDVVVPANTWTPIGNSNNFQGTFDGKGHEIKGVYVTGDANYLGLFGYVNGEKSKVMDLSLTNSYVEQTTSKSDGVFVGGVVGYLSKGTIDEVYCNAIVKSNGTEFGGIAGRAEGLVEGCWFDGEVYANRTDATYVKAAGIVGTSWSQTGTGKAFTPLTIRNCLNTGSVTYNVTTTSGAGAGLGGIYGGDRGYTDVTVEYCINTGIIETNQKNGTGSIVGNISQNTTIDSVKTYSEADIKNCYGATNTISTRTDGRIFGYKNANCTVTQTDNVTQDAENMNGHVAYNTIKGGLSVLTSQVQDGEWAIREQSDVLKAGVPVPAAFADNNWIDVAWYYDAEKSDDQGETYSISTAEELYGFSAISQDYNFEGDTIQLANDITVNSGAASSWKKGTTTPARQWKPIGKDTAFAGTFDGQEKTISGIYVNETTLNAGLFAATQDDVSTIKNIRLKNSYIYSSVSGNAQVGSIIGYSARTKLTNIYSNAYVESPAGNRVGGIVGELFNANRTKDISECWFDGSVQGSTYVGGIVGRDNNGTSKISNVLVTGAVKSTKETDANYYTGGIIGGLRNAAINLTIENSVHVGTVEDSCTTGDKLGGVVGYKPETAAITINGAYTTFGKGVGTQNNNSNNSTEAEDYPLIENINDIKGSQVYTNDVMNLGYYLYDSTWVARTTDIPVPRCFVGTVVDENDIVEDTSAHTAWYDADPDATEFEIKTENDLLGFAEIVNASEGDYASEQFSGQTVKLAKDMDLNRGWNAPETATDAVVEPDIIWTPIGNGKNFQGTFDGQGHEIKGIYVTGDTNYLGLFGYVNGANSMVMNLRLTNSYVEQTNAKTFVGGVAGYLNKGTINQVYCKAIVKSNGTEFGGIVGRAEGLVEECWFDGEVYANRIDATYVKAAGIVGTSWSNTGASDTDYPLTIRNCLNTGKVIYNVETTSGSGAGIGGIYGGDRAYTDLTVEDCVNTGIIETNQANGTGSIVGNISKSTKITNSTLNGVTTYSKAEITNCYGAKNTISNRTDGRIFGYKNANCTVTQTDNVTRDIEAMKGEVVYNAVDDGGLDLNYAIWTARTTDVPVPIYFVGKIVAEEDTVKDNSGRVYVDTGWYTQYKNASTYSIETAHELAGLAQLVNDDGVTFNNKTINLVKDIDLNEDWTAPATATDEVVAPLNTWTPIGVTNSFQGTFDGHGHEIKGVYVTGKTTYLGLFGYVNGANATIMDLRLTNSYVEHTGATAFVGGVVGYLNKGTIKQVYSNAIVKSNGIEFGGIVGRAEGLVEGCWFDGEVYANRTDVVYVKAAGIVGTSWSQTGTGKTFTALTIRNCLNTGKVTYNVETAAGTGAGIGGIYGGDRGYSDVTVEYCLNTGIIETNQANGTGSIVGQISQNTTIDSVKTYSTAEITNCYGATDSISNRTDGRIRGYKNANCTVTETDNVTIEKEVIFGLGAQLLTTLDFVQDAEETIWAARRGQIPAPAGLVADSDKLNVQFGKADQEIADGATGDSAEDPYIIENVEELYGFAVLSRTDNFAGKFIKLSDDIDVLDLNPGESAEDWAEGTVASLPWYSIGTSSKRFAGHFDGNGKTISGIYMNDDSSYLGLFAATETGSTITNLRLTNSYINYTGNGTAYTGSVVGDLRGDMTNVYSDAIVNSNGERTGGLVGQATDASEDENYAVDITNCWYDGQLTSSKTNAAGLLARINGGTVNVDNCLSTGAITTTATSANENNAVAGICSQVAGAAVATISDTISAGEITDAAHGKNVKSVVGYISNGTVSFADVFATKTSYARSYPSKSSTSGSYTGTVLRTQESDRFIGYCVEGLVEESVQLEPKLEFGTNEWTIRTSDVPVPTCFADLVTPVTADELNTQIGLDYLNTTLGTTLTLADAVDMGEGNYVLNATVNDTVYATYKSTLEDIGFGTPAVENVVDDVVHSVSYKQTNPDWVVTLTYVETTDALTISINTDTDSLSDKLVDSDDEITYATGDVKLTMLQMYELVDVKDEEGNVTGTTQLSDIYADLSSWYFNNKSYWYGNSFVFQVSEDHFVVNDGGAKEEYDDLVNYMKAAVGTTEDGVQKPVYIDAWTISHQHADHADVLKAVADDPTLANGVYVDAFYISEPNAKILSDNALYDDAEKQYYGMTLFAKNESGEQSDIYRMHTGQRYNFNGLVMDVIQTQDQIPYSEYGDYNANNSGKKDFNTASTVTLFSTATKKVLIGGDANYINMEYIMKAYDTDETDGTNYTPTSLLQNIDVFAAFHHGKNMSMKLSTLDKSFIDYLTYGDHTFDYVLYPCSLVYGDASDPVGAFPNAGEANTYLNGKANAYAHFGNGNVEITLNGATTE